MVTLRNGFFGAALLVLAGCATTQFAAVTAGQVAINDLTVSPSDSGWNKAPDTLTPWLHPASEVWTRDGVLLDRLILVPGVMNGGTLFKSTHESLVYPEFRAGMLPNEVADLTVSSVQKLLGTDAAVTMAHLRPHRLGEQRAVMFDLEIEAGEMPRRQGRVLAFVSSDRLYMLVYIAAAIHYFDKHWEQALAVMESARIVSVDA